MGMTIKEAIPIIHDLYNYYSDEMVEPYVGFDLDDKQAIETALDTMRKYQQIENIVDAYVTDNPREPMYDTEDYMQSIREVIEGGKDN